MRGFFAEHGRYLLFDSPRYLFFAFSRRKKLVFVILLQVSLLVGGVFFYFNFSTTSYRNNLQTDQQAFPAAKKFLKTILVWNGPDRIETAIFGTGHQTFINNGCPENRCYIDQADQNSLPFESYDAIIINMNELWKFQFELWKILPWAIKQLQLPRWQRPSHQRFIFFSQEAPTYLPINPSNFADYFNWTMTYRLDSDIPLLYGRITPLTSANITQMRANKNYALNKTRAVVWMASHCNTSGQREKYVEQLRKFIAVDVYGRCGNLTCPRNESHWISEPHCYRLISSTYKFYLSFENSVCQDYVTEKFFNLMQHDIVPVVYGGADYDRIAPPHSYIDARKFTPQELAEYLKMVDADDSLYNRFFHWKGYYHVESGVEQMARRAFCDLCQKLHNVGSSAKFYRELDSRWHVKTQCKI